MLNNKKLLPILTVALAAMLVVLLVVAFSMTGNQPDPTEPTPTVTEAPTDPPTEAPTEEPTEPPITKESTATIGVTGDILMHDRVIACGYNSATGTYNYDHIYQHWKKYVSAVDYAVANLEVTLCSNTNGYDYKGYPCFNSPDAVPEALKAAGFDMLLTANNHTYDTRNVGMMRTQQVIESLGFDYIGTRQNAADDNFIVKDINGIKIGMVNYTYTTDMNDEGKVALNGIPLTLEDSMLINAFNYWRLNAFYAKLSGQIEQMKEQGAEAIVLYIHWGDEYHTEQNSTQSKMAQDLCNLGIDVIVGNHAHVPQPVALLTNENDPSQKTLCIYSTGNAVSNISRSDNRPVNTEDGMLFSFTFAKYTDGTVVLESADVLPTWVDRMDEQNDWKDQFIVLPLDDEIEDWAAELGIDNSTLNECKNSYDRTMGIVGAGLADANAYFAQHQLEVEAEIGVKN